MSSRYVHRQAATPLISAVVGAMVLTFVVVSLAAGASAALVGVAIPAAVVAVVVSMFGSMTTEVVDGHVRAVWAFGWPARVIPAAHISRHEVVRNRWWYGLGLRWFPGGMLYSVWGLDAVEVVYTDGNRQRTIRIGTDDPHGLAAAIADARTATSP